MWLLPLSLPRNRYPMLFRKWCCKLTAKRDIIQIAKRDARWAYRCANAHTAANLSYVAPLRESYVTEKRKCSQHDDNATRRRKLPKPVVASTAVTIGKMDQSSFRRGSLSATVCKNREISWSFNWIDRERGKLPLFCATSTEAPSFSIVESSQLKCRTMRQIMVRCATMAVTFDEYFHTVRTEFLNCYYYYCVWMLNRIATIYHNNSFRLYPSVFSYKCSERNYYFAGTINHK